MSGRPSLLVLAALVSSISAARASPVGCQSSQTGSPLSNVLVTQGNHSPPMYVHPDDDLNDLADNTFSNLSLSEKPVAIHCTFADGSRVDYRLPDSTDKCTIYSRSPVTLACE